MKITLPAMWKVFAAMVVVAQIQKIHLAYINTIPYTLIEAFDWIMSFPECVIVCLFVSKVAIGSPMWWRAFSFIYPIYAIYVVWICVKLYIFRDIPAGHPIPFGLALLVITAAKVFSAYAIWQYGRDANIWRSKVDTLSTS